MKTYKKYHKKKSNRNIKFIQKGGAAEDEALAIALALSLSEKPASPAKVATAAKSQIRSARVERILAVNSDEEADREKHEKEEAYLRELGFDDDRLSRHFDGSEVITKAEKETQVHRKAVAAASPELAVEQLGLHATQQQKEAAKANARRVAAQNRAEADKAVIPIQRFARLNAERNTAVSGELRNLGARAQAKHANEVKQKNIALSDAERARTEAETARTEAAAAAAGEKAKAEEADKRAKGAEVNAAINHLPDDEMKKNILDNQEQYKREIYDQFQLFIKNDYSKLSEIKEAHKIILNIYLQQALKTALEIKDGPAAASSDAAASLNAPASATGNRSGIPFNAQSGVMALTSFSGGGGTGVEDINGNNLLDYLDFSAYIDDKATSKLLMEFKNKDSIKTERKNYEIIKKMYKEGGVKFREKYKNIAKVMNTILAMDNTDVLKKAKEFNEQFALIQKSGPLDDLLVTIKGPQTLAFGKVVDVQVLPDLSSKSILTKSKEYDMEYKKAVEDAKNAAAGDGGDGGGAGGGEDEAKRDEEEEEGNGDGGPTVAVGPVAPGLAEQEAIATALAISSAIAVA